MKDVFVKMLDGLQDAYLECSTTECLNLDKDEDSCYSRGDEETCPECTTLTLFTKLKDSLA